MVAVFIILEIILVCLCACIYAEREKEPTLTRFFIAICPGVNLVFVILNIKVIINNFWEDFDLRNPKVIGLFFITCLLLTSCNDDFASQYRTIYRIHYSNNYVKTDTIETKSHTYLKSYNGTNVLRTRIGSDIVSTTAPIEIVSCKEIKRR